MISLAPPSSDYLEFSRRLMQLHALIRIGKGESDEAEAIRDDMDDYYLRLSPSEIDRLNLLSSDLNSIGEGVPPVTFTTPVEEVARKRQAVSGERDPDKMREYLGSETNDLSWNALLRFIYWSLLEDFEAARPFAQFILVGLEKDIIVKIQAFLLKEKENFMRTSLTSTESNAEELHQKAEHLRRSEATLQNLTSKLDLMKKRIGSLGDDDQSHTMAVPTPQDSKPSPQEIMDYLIELYLGLSKVSQAA